MTVYVVNIVLNVLVVFALGFAIAFDWHGLRKPWRPVLIAGWVQESVLLYGSIEAARANVPIELRQLLFTLTLIGLVVSSVAALIATRHPGPRYSDEIPRVRS